MSYFLASNCISRLFDQLDDYKALIGPDQKEYTLNTCGTLTFADIADENQVSVVYRLQDKFKNSSLLNFVNIFGDQVRKKDGSEEAASNFLRNRDKPLKIIYADSTK